jgi:tetratricopeptide (TPR) repeat protein
MAVALAAARQGDLLEAARLAGSVTLSEQTPEQALVLTHLRGGIAFELGQLDEAEICFEQVIRVGTEQRNQILIGKASNNLGSIAHLRGKAQLAASFYRCAMQAYTAEDDATGLAQTGHNLSIVLREFGDLKAAGLHSERALAAAERSANLALQALVLSGLAEVAMLQDDLDRTADLLLEAARLSDLAGDRIGQLEVRRLRARADFRLGHFAAALREAGHVYLASQRLGALHLSGESAQLAAEVAQSLARPRLASRYRHRAQEAYRRLGSPVRADLVGEPTK